QDINCFNALSKVRLQDGQLYRVAMHYLSKDDKINDIKSVHIMKFLSTNFVMQINDNQNVIVPFRSINKYEEIMQFNQSIESKFKGSSILLNFDNFYNKFKREPSLTSINPAALQLSDISKLTNVMVLKQAKFT